MTINFCPRCKLDIPIEMLQSEIVICPHCAWVKNSRNENVEASISKQFIKFSIGISVVFILTFIHSVNWGPYFFESIPLKLKSVFGMASVADYSRLASMCKELKDAACVEAMLSHQAAKNSKDIEVLAELGQVQLLRKHYQQAVLTYAKYFSLGGESLDASYTYAKALAEIGQVDRAIQHFERILAAKPNALQITITQAYVQMLIKSGRTARAMAVIQSIRSKGSNAAMFMESEMRKLASQ